MDNWHSSWGCRGRLQIWMCNFGASNQLTFLNSTKGGNEPGHSKSWASKVMQVVH
jgi:hypothetical protein